MNAQPHESDHARLVREHQRSKATRARRRACIVREHQRTDRRLDTRGARRRNAIVRQHQRRNTEPMSC